MTRPIFYFDDVSPPVRSCLLIIKLLDIEVDYKYVNLFEGAHLKQDFLKINPAHTVPTLVHNELVLSDSHAILMYLCDTSSKALAKRLFPEDFKDRMQVINRLFFDCSILFRRDSDLMSEIVRKGFDNIDFHYHERRILEAYSIMENFLNETHKFMAGSNLSIADISLVTTVSTTDLMFPIETAGEQKWPRLSQWFRLMKSLPEYRLNQVGLNKLRTVIEEVGKFKFPTALFSLADDLSRNRDGFKS